MATLKEIGAKLDKIAGYRGAKSKFDESAINMAAAIYDGVRSRLVPSDEDGSVEPLRPLDLDGAKRDLGPYCVVLRDDAEYASVIRVAIRALVVDVVYQIQVRVAQGLPADQHRQWFAVIDKKVYDLGLAQVGTDPRNQLVLGTICDAIVEEIESVATKRATTAPASHG